MAQLDGSKEVAAALQALSANIQARVLRKSAVAGARVVRNQIRALAPVASQTIRRANGGFTTPGTLQKSIVLKFASEKSSPTAATYVVAVRHGKSQQKSGRDAFYYLWVEKGHGIVTRGGRSVGSVPPHAFFVPGYSSSSNVARQAMKDAMEKALSDVITNKA